MANPASFETSAAFSNLVKVSAKYSAEQNDHVEEEGSGMNPTEEPKNPIQTLVKAVSDSAAVQAFSHVICNYSLETACALIGKSIKHIFEVSWDE